MRHLLLAALLAGCGATPPPAASPAAEETAQEAAPPAESAQTHLAAGEAAAEAGDLEAAQLHLQAALDLAPDDELGWRIRARLAALQARAGHPQAARETAGLLCGTLDPGMAPPYFAALVAEVEAANVCRGVCAQLSPCCHAFVAAMAASSGAAMNADETCRALDELSADQLNDELCTQILDGWRQALGNLPGATVPPECR